MPSGLRVTRIDRAPAVASLDFLVNGLAIGGLLHRTSLEITVAPGEILLEIGGRGVKPLFEVLEVPPGCTASVLIGRRCTLGLVDDSHYIQVDGPLLGVPDRSLYPLNLAGHTALEWLQQKRALGEPLSGAQLSYLRSHLPPIVPPHQTHHPSVPSLAQLGAFAALGLDTDAQEEDVREAFRLLISIHTPESGQPNETIQRLDEAYRIAMDVLAQRIRPGVSEVGR